MTARSKLRGQKGISASAFCPCAQSRADGLAAAAVLAKSVWQAAGNALKSRVAESRARRGDTAYAGPHGPGGTGLPSAKRSGEAARAKRWRRSRRGEAARGWQGPECVTRGVGGQIRREAPAAYRMANRPIGPGSQRVRPDKGRPLTVSPSAARRRGGSATGEANGERRANRRVAAKPPGSAARQARRGEAGPRAGGRAATHDGDACTAKG